MRRSAIIDSRYNFNSDDFVETPSNDVTFNTSNQTRGSAAIVPDLPPRIDHQPPLPKRYSKPNGATPPSTLLPAPNARSSSSSTTNGAGGTYGRSAHERLFASGVKPLNDNNPTYEDEYSTRVSTTPDKRNSSLERKIKTPLIDKLTRSSGPSSTNANATSNGSYDSVSSYDESCNNTQTAIQNMRLGPNAPDDLKSVPNIK